MTETSSCQAVLPPSAILVMDQDPRVLHSLADLLSDGRFKLTLTQNRESALQALQSSRRTGAGAFDLVLLGHSGAWSERINLVGDIKAATGNHFTPVVMQGDAQSDACIVEGLRAGAHYFVTEPVKRSALIGFLERALARHSGSLAGAGKRLDFDALNHAVVRFRSLDDTRTLAEFFSAACPDPEQAMLGLGELMINAVEHGNLGISYADKSRLLAENRWLEEVNQRLAAPEAASRFGILTFWRKPDALVFEICDQGCGFDWQSYLEIQPERAYDMHGRGIALSKIMSFTDVQYSGAGNVVTATITL